MDKRPIKGRENLGQSELLRRMIPAETDKPKAKRLTKEDIINVEPQNVELSELKPEGHAEHSDPTNFEPADERLRQELRSKLLGPEPVPPGFREKSTGKPEKPGKTSSSGDRVKKWREANREAERGKDAERKRKKRAEKKG